MCPSVCGLVPRRETPPECVGWGPRMNKNEEREIKLGASCLCNITPRSQRGQPPHLPPAKPSHQEALDPPSLESRAKTSPPSLRCFCQGF